MRLWYRICLFFVRICFRLFYRLEVRGIENLPSSGCILAANHTSYLDPPAVALSCKREVHFLARPTLFRNPIFGPLIRSLNAHPSRLGAQAVEEIKSLITILKKGAVLVVFPEGTRSKNGLPQALKRGAATLSLLTNMPIVPVHISGAFTAWPTGQRWPKMRRATIICTFSPLLSPQPYLSLPKKEAYASMTRQLTLAIHNHALNSRV